MFTTVTATILVLSILQLELKQDFFLTLSQAVSINELFNSKFRNELLRTSFKSDRNDGELLV